MKDVSATPSKRTFDTLLNLIQRCVRASSEPDLVIGSHLALRRLFLLRIEQSIVYCSVLVKWYEQYNPSAREHMSILHIKSYLYAAADILRDESRIVDTNEQQSLYELFQIVSKLLGELSFVWAPSDVSIPLPADLFHRKRYEGWDPLRSPV